MRSSVDKSVKAVYAAYGDQEKPAKKISCYLCCRYSGAKLKEIGKEFCIGDAAVSPASKKLLLEAGKDPEVKSVIERFEKFLGRVKA